MGNEYASRIREAGEGSASATARVLEDCYDRLPPIAAQQLGELVRARESATDIVQSACREFLHRAPDWARHDRDGALRWLSISIERKVIEKYRYWTAAKRDVRAIVRKRLGPGEDDDRLPEPAAPRGGPVNELEERESREALREARRTFNARVQRVLELREQGLSTDEIARRLDCPEGTVRSDLHRAEAKLKGDLDPPTQ